MLSLFLFCLSSSFVSLPLLSLFLFCLSSSFVSLPLLSLFLFCLSSSFVSLPLLSLFLLTLSFSLMSFYLSLSFFLNYVFSLFLNFVSLSLLFLSQMLWVKGQPSFAKRPKRSLLARLVLWSRIVHRNAVRGFDSRSQREALITPPSPSGAVRLETRE